MLPYMIYPFLSAALGVDAQFVSGGFSSVSVIATPRLSATATLAATQIPTTTTAAIVLQTTSEANALTEPTAVSFVQPLAFSAINQSLHVPDLPPQVSISCYNCSTYGSLEFALGGFTKSDNFFSLQTLAEVDEIIEYGFIEFVAKGVGANFTLELAIKEALNNNYTIPVFHFTPLFNVLVLLDGAPLGTFGLDLEVNIPLSLKLDAEVDIYPELVITVPENSTLLLAFGIDSKVNGSHLYSHGFNQTTLVPSLNFNVPHLEFDMMTGIEYSLHATFSPDGLGQMTANTTLELPTVSINVTELHNVNSSCDPPREHDVVYDSATNIQYDVGFDFDFSVGADIANSSKLNVSYVGSETAISYVLPSSCLRFDSKDGQLVDATASIPLVSSATSSGTSGPAGQNAAPRSLASTSGLRNMCFAMFLAAGIVL